MRFIGERPDDDNDYENEMIRLWRKRRITRNPKDVDNFDKRRHILDNMHDAMERAVSWVQHRPGQMVSLFALDDGSVFFDDHSRGDYYDHEDLKRRGIYPLLPFDFMIFSDINERGYEEISGYARTNLSQINTETIKPDSDGILFDMHLADLMGSLQNDSRYNWKKTHLEMAKGMTEGQEMAISEERRRRELE